MTNILKRIVNPITCIVFALCVFVGEASADELIRYNSTQLTAAGSIIRHYKDSMDIVCHHAPGKSPYFMMYKEGQVTSYAFYLEHMDTVYDFEIYNDTVYFCGIGHPYRASVAVIGYFRASSLSGSSPTNVSYVAMPSMATVNAIEVGWFASRKHVVGIGIAINSESSMVDMIDESTYWNVNFGLLGTDTISLSDLAITSRYVVVTSTRVRAGLVKRGRICYIDKPTTPGTSLFPTNWNFLDLNDSVYVTDKYLIKALVDDKFVTAYHNDFSFVGTNPFTVSYYDGTVYDRSVVIDESSANYFSLGGIHNERVSKTVELLVYGMQETAGGTIPRTLIYEIPNVNPVPPAVLAHVYDGAFFESIDESWTLNLDDRHFVLPGYKPYGYSTPYYMKFNFNYFEGACLNYKGNIARNVKIKHKWGKNDVGYSQTQQIPTIFIYENVKMTVLTECYHHPVYTPEN